MTSEDAFRDFLPILMKWITILICAALHLKVDAMSTGAPLDACESMLPNHPTFSPQLSEPPIEVDYPVWSVFPGDKVEVTIRTTGVPFRGFFIQARPLSEDTPIGRFSSSDEVNAINCFGMIQSAATHTSSIPKSQVIVEWEAPDITTEAIVFEFL